jgi:hypothetical protein
MPGEKGECRGPGEWGPRERKRKEGEKGAAEYETRGCEKGCMKGDEQSKFPCRQTFKHSRRLV